MTIDEMNKAAQLAQLGLSREAEAEYGAQLNDILGMTSSLEAVDTQDVSPMTHPLDMHAGLRPDVADAETDRQAYQAIAPDTEDGLYRVPRVMD